MFADRNAQISAPSLAADRRRRRHGDLGLRNSIAFVWSLGLVALSGCNTLDRNALGLAANPEPDYEARISRTQGGIPHIVADDLGSLGFGTLYAMAEDNFCILADQYLTFGAERARQLGPGENDANVSSDFFYQLLIDRGDADERLPPDLETLFEGAAAGYNQFLRTLLATREADPESRVQVDPKCRDAAWLREARAIDLRRVSRIDYALAYMLPILVGAAPPVAASETGDPATRSTTPDERADRVGHDPASEIEIARRIGDYLEVPRQGGSNGVALGRTTTAHGGGMLLANPHMPWNVDFQRFYPFHQTIPGEFDILGANLLGRPRVGFGATEHVAWTSTVSTAQRLSFYRLELDTADPTRYVFDGKTRPLRKRTVRVSVRTAAGPLEERTHVFYSTHFGALLVESPLFPWTTEHAFAVRLVDAGWRGETSLRPQYDAKNVRELKAVHDANQFLPVNLIAADASGEVLYADPGPIPNLPDAVLADCSVLQGAALDGTRSACQWRDDAEAAAPGIFAPRALPFLYRDDFVTNSNDSYWLPNPKQPLEGFPRSLGSEKTKRTLRTRSGLAMVEEAIAEAGGVTLDALQTLALSNRSEAGRLIRDDLVELCRANPIVRLADRSAFDLTEACDVLARWDLRSNLDSRGAILFRLFLTDAKDPGYARHLPADFAPRVPFDVNDAVATPSGLAKGKNDHLLESLVRAAQTLASAGFALDISVGEAQGVTRQGERIPLHGGPEAAGVFNKIEADWKGSSGYSDVDRWSSSWILAVALGEGGPRARGVLTYSLSANPESPHATDQTRMFSRKEWVGVPFHSKDVKKAATRRYRVRNER